jgi:hypothetical protein
LVVKTDQESHDGEHIANRDECGVVCRGSRVGTDRARISAQEAPMKISFSTISCPAYTAKQMCRAAQEFGYDAVELYALEGERLTVPVLEQRLDDLRRTFRARGRRAGLLPQ